MIKIRHIRTYQITKDKLTISKFRRNLMDS